MVNRCQSTECRNFTFASYCFKHTQLDVLPIQSIILTSPIPQKIPNICSLCMENEISDSNMDQWKRANHIGHALCDQCLGQLNRMICPFCTLPLDNLVTAGVINDLIYSQIINNIDAGKRHVDLSASWRSDLVGFAMQEGYPIKIENIYEIDPPPEYSVDARDLFFNGRRYVAPPPGWDDHFETLTLPSPPGTASLLPGHETGITTPAKSCPIYLWIICVRLPAKNLIWTWMSPRCLSVLCSRKSKNSKQPATLFR